MIRYLDIEHDNKRVAFYTFILTYGSSGVSLGIAKHTMEASCKMR